MKNVIQPDFEKKKYKPWEKKKEVKCPQCERFKTLYKKEKWLREIFQKATMAFVNREALKKKGEEK